MRKLLLICLAFFFTAYSNAQFNIIGSAQNGASSAANNNASNAGSNAVNNGVKGLFGSKKKAPKDTSQNTNNAQPSASSSSNSSTPSSSSNSNTPAAASTASSPQASPESSYKAYSNYDFVPGDTIIFADDFTDDQDGEFPSHWNLDAGQGILNKVGTDEAFALTQGNYATVSPRMKNQSYLTKTFTVEFNYYSNGAYPTSIFFHEPGDKRVSLSFSDEGGVSSSYFPKDFSAPFPGSTSAFKNSWHHAAFIFKNGTIKCYVDQYRVLVMPNVDFNPTWIQFGGIAGQDNPLLFKDVRIASGGNMNSIAQKFTDAKIVTHGINFDVDKATIKPESMGTLNMIVKVMQNTPDLKFEVDGHTDNSGNSQHNMTLSQQRADAVEAQLISMGIDASRLTTKGFGDTKPISSNDTQDGKANNRRVEFVKM
jgi:OmpA-OmpF porin, OOP family